MREKKQMTAYEQSLFNDLKKLSKRANQRIVRLERLTDTKEPFEVKKLADTLSIEGVNGWTKSGRVRASMNMDVLSMRATIKEVKKFLSSPLSRVAGVKEYHSNLEKNLGKKITYKQSSSIYKAKKDWKWILEYMDESEFWDFARESVKENWSEEVFEENIMVYIWDSQLDETLKNDIKDLFDYAQGVTGV